MSLDKAFRGAFLGQVRLVPFLGQGSIPQPADFAAELADYKQRAAMVPGDQSNMIQQTLQTCEAYMAPGMFSPMRMRGCLNSALAQLRAAGV